MPGIGGVAVDELFSLVTVYLKIILGITVISVVGQVALDIYEWIKWRR